MAATAGSSPIDEEGCRQRTVPTFAGDSSSASTMMEAESKRNASQSSNSPNEVGFSSCSVDKVSSDDFQEYVDALVESFPLKSTERANLSQQIRSMPAEAITIEKVWQEDSQWVSVCVMMRVQRVADAKEVVVAHSCNSRRFQGEQDAQEDLQSLKNVTKSKLKATVQSELEEHAVSSSGWELGQDKDSEEPGYAPVDPAVFNAFVFPHALDTDCLEGNGKVSDDDDEDTDAVEELPLTTRLMEGKLFSDPEENEKWKNRGWRAVQCCGGALLVLALIFDEMD